MVIVLGFFSLLVAAFAVYSKAATDNYRQLRTNEVLKTVAFESERVDKVIAEMERNAIDLALAGRHFYKIGDIPSWLGISISVENFNAFTAAVGGGIWFEPYSHKPSKRWECYYSFFDPSINAVRYDPNFETREYDYHTQMWYKTIAAGLDGKHRTVWTAPYYDDTGTNSMMTTVGAGIYDDDGKFVGMSTVDWEIQSMIDRLSAIKPTTNSFVLIASVHDDYIISNTYTAYGNRTRHIGKSLSSLPWFSKLNFTESDAVDINRFKDGGVEYLAFSCLLDNNWLFSIQIPVSEIFSEIETRNNQFRFVIVVSSFLLFALVSWLLSWLINRPLLKLTSDVAELGSGNLDKQIKINSRDEIGTLALAFNKMTVNLKASIEQNVLERAEKERIAAELDVAAKIQSSILPCIFPPFPNHTEFDIYASMQPAKQVGGDFYDFFLVDDHTLAVVIADVSGNGIPAALFMVITKTLIKNNAQYGKSPKKVFEDVNNILVKNNDANMFVTAFMGYLDIRSGKLTYVNAGHNPPLLRSGDRFNRVWVKPGFVLAVMEDIIYTQEEVILKPGDELFLYTDGVTEAENREKKLFGNARLLNAVNNYLDFPIKEFTVKIKREVDKYADGAEQSDDITMLLLRYKG
ncbi:MAG: SpoIIE family protein phosphatase [Spirochaetaceae bacterium]|nr:SpoIIE family protein phosphatase [Spirochaetaceae bacterium]